MDRRKAKRLGCTMRHGNKRTPVRFWVFGSSIYVILPFSPLVLVLDTLQENNMRTIILTVAILAALAAADCVHNTCTGCTGDAGCGWCQTTQTCTDGTSTGPTSGSCVDWDYLNSDCPAPLPPNDGGCSQYKNCDGCTETSNCGWCASTSTCSIGTGSGPSSGSCAKWEWLDSDCTPNPAPTESCSSHFGCSGCTTDPSDSCGWCNDDLSCKKGTSSGPTTGTCVSWDWVVPDCPSSADKDAKLKATAAKQKKH